MIVVRTTKKGERRYLVRVETPFGREVAKTFRLRRDAESWERETLEAGRRGVGLPPPPSIRHKTVAGLWADGLRGRSARWQARTEARYTELYRVHVGPAWGRVQAQHVTVGALREWVAELLDRGLAPATVAQAVTVLGVAMREAVELGIRPDNPCRGLRPPPTPPEQRRALTVAEVARLVAAAPAGTAPIYLLAATCGLRYGELVGLDVGDVDVAAGVVRVRQVVVEVDGYQQLKPFPKAGAASRRTVGLPEVVGEALRPLLARPADAPLWPNATGGRRWYATSARELRAALAAARIEGQGGFHSLRRTAATLALQAQASPRDVMLMLGHSTPTMTLTRYAQADVTTQRDAVERVAAAITKAEITKKHSDPDKIRTGAESTTQNEPETDRLRARLLVRPLGLEPRTCGLRVRCSAKLS